MKTVFILLLLAIPLISFAAAPDVRISDKWANVVNITSGGSLVISTTNSTSTTNNATGAHDIRISDANGTVVNITSTGLLLLKTN
jgi:Glu-tRNA(Gln) amidotransferase subunit E-like FAD-binding protein